MKEIPYLMHVKTVYILMFITQYILLGFILDFAFDSTVFLFLLVSFTGIALRWRIQLTDYVIVIEVLLFFLLFLIDVRAIYFVFILLYQLSFKGRPYFSLLFLIYLFAWNNDINLILLTLQTTIFGYILYEWNHTSTNQMRLYDQMRMEKYDLVYEQAQLSYENIQIENAARAAERQKIAEMLHDDLGHELSAASLSMKAYKTLLERNDETADKHLNVATLKLNSALESLKAAVKTIEPVNHQLNDQLIQMIDEFMYPINFKIIGSMHELSMIRYQMIITITKEALTNILKHAKPTRINYLIEINDYLIKLLISNDGVNNERLSTGHGLRYMRKRIESFGGTLSIQKAEEFRLLVTLPVKEYTDENHTR